MAETPNKTAAELFANLPAVAQRPSLAVNEIIRRLEQNLPGLIEEANTQLELGDGLAIIAPSLPYRWAQAVLNDIAPNTIVVAMESNTEGLAPRIFKNQLTIVVRYFGPEVETNEAAAELFDIGGLIQGALHQFVNGCQDEQERWCWHQLVPTGIGPLPVQWEGFSGCEVHFAATQHPGTNTRHWT